MNCFNQLRFYCVAAFKADACAYVLVLSAIYGLLGDSLASVTYFPGEMSQHSIVVLESHLYGHISLVSWRFNFCFCTELQVVPF